MGKSDTKRYLHMSYKRIITYMCYTSLIIGWQRFNCISLLGVMSMEFLNGNNDLTTAEEAVNLSLTSMKSVENEALDRFPSVLSEESILDSSKLDFGTPNAVDNSPIRGWECYCWNTTTGYVYGEGELECRCKGLALVRVPQRLPVNMQRLSISAAGIPMLRYTGLKKYGSSLQDIMFTDLMEFESIQPGAFSKLACLRTIYISNCRKLMYLSANVFEGITPTFKSLRIINCALKRIPDMSYLSTGTIFNMVDFEGNQIDEIYPKSVKIRTEQFILNNNDLTYIHDSAFFGSEIAKLSFKANKKLRNIHQNGFAGILNVMELDLSNTSIESMPHNGLEKLEVLRIQNTHSLKTIPSVYAFQNLRYAWLTHPFHCCAFKFPQRHDPQRHAQREKYLAELHKKCMNNELMMDTKVKHDGNFANLESIETFRQLNGSTDVIDETNATNKLLYKRAANDPGESFYNHFEDSVIGSFTENSSLEYSISSSDSNAITGAPVSYQDNSDVSNNFLANNIDFGEFMDSTADVDPDKVKHAVCGKLTIKKIDIKCFPVPDALNPCEDVMGSQWLRTSVWIVVLLAVFGNVAVLLVLFSNWNEVTVPKFLISHLAFADLCLGLYLLLIASIDIHSMGEYFNFAYDWQYGIGCKVAGFLTVFATHLSVFTLTLITIERWYAITHAIYLNKRIKIRAASCIMVCGWIYSMVMSSLPLFGFSNYSSTRYGLFQKTAQQYKMNYSIPTTHQTCPIPLLDRRRSSSQPDPNGGKKLKDETNRKEDFV
ncbi:thyrotropin receptor isoform X2 [Sitodiplosis mosellana]|uniref:thyrotropin receptor isoform X2 n=1 Tax=Sitodiplosis mosellana TaxID=263140 RepID=UPI00244446A3|nr:thyrotropin receptor isoform X2 [Sitodiplosis mosellana]